jgi:hypothetical protein
MKSRRNIRIKRRKSKSRTRNRIKRTRKMGGMSLRGSNGMGPAGLTQQEMINSSPVLIGHVGTNFSHTNTGKYAMNNKLAFDALELKKKNNKKIRCPETVGKSIHDSTKETITYSPSVPEEISSGIFGYKFKKEIYKKGTGAKFLNRMIDALGTGSVISKVFYKKNRDDPDHLVDHTISYYSNNKAKFTNINGTFDLDETKFPRCDPPPQAKIDSE